MFKLKYLKYKQKYLNLKNLKIGGMNPNPNNPLLIALLNRNSYDFNNLLSQNQNQNLEEKFDGKTLLMIAVENNQSYELTILLENGANTEVQFNGKTPLIIAVENYYHYNVRKLIQYGANLETRFNGKTPLIIAVENNLSLIVRELLNYNANPNVIDLNSGDSALFIAVKLNLIQIVELLLDRKANIFFMNSDKSQNNGKTIFDFIIENNIQDIINLDSFRRIQALLDITNRYSISKELIIKILELV